MGVLSRLIGGNEKRGTLRNPSAADLLALANQKTVTGVSVTPESAMAYTAVLACVRVLSESVATLPLILYERLDRGKRRATDHWLYSLLHDAPNPAMTRFEWMTTAVGHLAAWGNSYNEIEINGAGRPVALWPLPPNKIVIAGSPVTGLKYTYQATGGTPHPIAAERMLHIRGLGGDGVVGWSVLRLAREAVGLGLATQEFGARWFGNGARPAVVLWNAQHEGLANSHRVSILEEGMDVETIGIPPEDSQFLETRKFQRTEIASIFRVPPHMIGDLERATFSNIEQQSLDFVIYTLAPWLACIEQRIGLALLTPVERQRLFAEFLVAGLLRGDIQSRYQAYAVGRNWGWLSANDVRELENLNPVDGGDTYLVPLNMVDAAAPAQPAAAPPVEQPADDESLDEDTDDTPPQSRRIVDWPETRRLAFYQRSVGRRRRLSAVGEGQIADAAQRVVNREANDIVNAARRFARRPDGVADFRAWLDGFLDEHQVFVRERLWSSTWALSQLAADEADNEANEAGYEGTFDEDGLRRFADEYMGSRATGWTAMLRTDIYNALDRAEQSDRSDGSRLERRADEPAQWLTEVETTLDDRRQNEADSWGRDEANRVVNAVAVTVWAALSVMFLRWSATGGENCPYCEKMDGRTIGIAQWFMQAGEGLDVEGLPSLRPGSNMRHPPLHRGCDCNVLIG